MKTEQEILQYIEDLSNDNDKFTREQHFSGDDWSETVYEYDYEIAQNSLVEFANKLLGLNINPDDLPSRVKEREELAERERKYKEHQERYGTPVMGIFGLNDSFYYRTCPSSCSDTQLIPNPDFLTPPNKEI